MFKAVLAFGALLVVMVRASPTQPKTFEYDVGRSSIIELEEPCVRQGGICVRNDDCESSDIPAFGDLLCPKQRHLGVVCCYL